VFYLLRDDSEEDCEEQDRDEGATSLPSIAATRVRRIDWRPAGRPRRCAVSGKTAGNGERAPTATVRLGAGAARSTGGRLSAKNGGDGDLRRHGHQDDVREGSRKIETRIVTN
jgi:hypothetical protein